MGSERETASLSAKELVFRTLRQRIVEGIYSPGEKILDKQIASELDVSRTPVREAIQVLVAQRFLDSFPRVGTVVSTIKKEDVFMLYRPLAAIQALAVEVAIEKITAEQIAALSLLNREFHDAVSQHNTQAAMEADKEFHDVIVTIADNPYITDASVNLQMHVQRLEYIFFKHVPIFTESLLEHDLIINSFHLRNPVIGREAMSRNWHRPMNILYQLLLEQEKDHLQI
ncbi:GntR family transcriptional regulator [Cohnella sp. LGH]|uniref:GntR family transcriptional regulator n=1 Tax=Cohnella sp. LGH TaxID=1619153 RepID=UPI001AD9B788|nr:GntR family transcriptional regulator [Cohnella sp. LGH]QTH45369.1 GntR family transcriptional regulator [Cohnella sp. LGH]